MTKIIAVGDRFGDVTIGQELRSDGRLQCICSKGHTLYYKQKALETHHQFCFLCTPQLLRQNLSGHVLGRVSILHPVGHDLNTFDVLWQARCSCSLEFQITSREIEIFSASGIFSCGCVPFDSCPAPFLAGQVFGKLTVLRTNPKYKAGPITSWLCRCACKRQVIRTRANLFDKSSVANCGSYSCRKACLAPRTPISLDANFRQRIDSAYQRISQQNLEEKEREAAAAARKKSPMPDTWSIVALRMMTNAKNTSLSKGSYEPFPSRHAT